MKPQYQGGATSLQYNQPASLSEQPPINQPINTAGPWWPEQPIRQSNIPVEPKKKKSKKLLIGILCAIVGIFTAAGIIIFVTFGNSDKMSCSGTYLSDTGVSITLYYNDKELVGYSATNMEFNLGEQKSYAKTIGIKEYLKEFQMMFENKFYGQCSLYSDINNTAESVADATFYGDGYELKYNQDRWTEVSVKTDRGSSEALTSSLANATLIPVGTSSLDMPFDTYGERKEVYNKFHEYWNTSDGNRITLTTTEDFTKIKEGVYLAAMKYVHNNTGKDGFLYLVVDKDANAVASFMSDAISSSSDVEVFNAAAKEVLNTISFGVLYDTNMYEYLNNLSDWNRYSKSIVGRGEKMDINGTWRVLSETGEATWVFKNGEYWWYKTYADLTDNYWYGSTSIIKGKAGLDRIDISEDSIKNLQSTGISIEDNVYAVVFTPEKIISSGIDKSDTNIEGEDWHFVWILIDHGSDGIEAQVFNAKTYDVSYYIKVAD